MDARVESILAGRRGRRLLLTYARISATGGSELEQAVFDASFMEDPRRVVLSADGNHAYTPVYGVDDVARFVDGVELLPVTDRLLSRCLVATVEAARYWQEPAGEDIVASAAVAQRALRRVAEHLVASGKVDWWFTSIDRGAQYYVSWEDPELGSEPLADKLRDPRAQLEQERRCWIAGEERALIDRPEDPTANWSGSWWVKPQGVPASSRAMPRGQEDGGCLPVHLECVEDSLGIERASVSRLAIPEQLRVYEIDSAQAWAELCRRFPLDQSMEKRHDWYRTTGRVGTWVIPDWAAVAEEYDGVHLQVGAYLALAGEVIDAGEVAGIGADVASTIAGWDPDVTTWFTRSIGAIGEPQVLERVETPDDFEWKCVTAS